MKRIYTTLFTLLVALFALTAQAQVMTIHYLDGTTSEVQVNTIDEITFDEESLPTLKNQYGYDTEVINLNTAIMIEEEGFGYYFGLFTEENANSDEDSPVVNFAMPSDSIGKTINLATADMSVLQITVNGQECPSLTGTLKVSFDKFMKNVTISLNSQTDDGHSIRAEWSGAFTTAFEAENAYNVTVSGYEPVEYDFVTVFRVKPASTGASTAFAFGDVEATTAEGLLSGSNAVWFTVSAAKVGTTIDLAADEGSYTFKYIDYSTGTVYTDVVSGTLTTSQTDGDQVYFEFEVTLEDGTVISGEYYGSVTDVESLDALIPEKQYGNAILYYNADGSEMVNQQITEVKYSTSKDYTYGTQVTTLYFVSEDANVSDPQATPQLSFTDNIVNVGTLNLPELEDGDLFKIYYKNMQLTSHDDKKYYNYSNYPDNGTVRISRDSDGNYDILLEVVNSYDTPATNITGGGDKSKIILSYKGTVVAK